MKQCLKCGEIKPLKDFHEDRNDLTGFKPKCRDCQYSDYKALNRKWERQRRAFREQKRLAKRG